jgi:hypothetical protein
VSAGAGASCSTSTHLGDRQMDSRSHTHHAQAQPIPHQHPHSHNFALPSLSPTDFFNGLELQPASANIQPGPRSYKSRKYRPCDFCRARQVACKIDITPPCQLCASHGRECTFVERPKKKRRPNAANGEGSASAVGGGQAQASGKTYILLVIRRMLLTCTTCSTSTAF